MNSRRSSCLCLPSAGMTGVYHHFLPASSLNFTTFQTPVWQPAGRVAVCHVLGTTLSHTKLMLKTTQLGGIITMFFVPKKKLRRRGQMNALGVPVNSGLEQMVTGICAVLGLRALRSVCSGSVCSRVYLGPCSSASLADNIHINY